MIRQTVIIIVLLISAICFGQQEQDTIQASNLLELERLENLLKGARERGDIQTEILVLNDLLYYKLGSFQDFTAGYFDAKNLESLIEENPQINISNQLKGRLFDHISFFLQNQGETNESITYINKAIRAANNDNDIRHAKFHLIRLAILENDLGNRVKSDSIFQHIENWAINKNDTEFLAAQFETKAWLNLKRGNYRETIKYGNQCLKLSNNYIRTTYNNMSEAYLGLNKPDSALIFAKKAFDAVLSFNHMADRANAHQNLRKSYAALNDFEKAYFHFNEYNEIVQKHNSYKNAQQIGNYNMQRQKEKTLIKEAITEEKFANQRLAIWLVSGSLLLLIIAVIIIFNRLKFIRKQNSIISEEKTRAEQSEKYKEQFLANMSHEIRTPMHAISGMINSLERNPHPKSQNKFLDAMKTSSDNLMNLLNDILDLSKMASGKLDIEKIVMNPIDVVENVVKTLKYKAQEKGLELNIEIANDFPERLICDPSRLNQILINLVGNAIKFTNQGFINILLSRTDDSVQFAIKDTGPGIASDKIDHIFEVFTQGEKTKSQIYGGTGLGLSISKQLVELQNGKIWVESILGQGSTFYIQLPIDKNEPLQESKPVFLDEFQPKEIGELLRGINILLVEDDDFNVMVVKDDLTYFIPEVNIEIANNGDEALKKFESKVFDLILMDKHMPILNGCETSKAIREIEQKRKVKKRIIIIAMTASLLKSEIEECMTSGMDAYIPKPYKPEELIIAISKFLNVL